MELREAVRPVAASALSIEGIAHGFFTREGGVSGGLYRGLNTGLGSDDNRANVLENRKRIAAYFDRPSDKIAGCYQVHSPDVVTITDTSDLEDRKKADALVTNVPGIILSIQTADCGPVLFADPSAHVIGAAHAGWKGATGGVLQNTVRAMEELGATRSNIFAVLGPTISQTNYEVGPEFVERLTGLSDTHARYLKPSTNADHAMFDLPGFIVDSLTDFGLASALWTGECTYAKEDRFFSFRRTTHRKEPDYGRQMSTIMLTY